MKIANLLSSILFTIGLYSCATSQVGVPENVQYEFRTVASMIKKHCSPSQYTPFSDFEILMVEKLDTPTIIGVCYSYPVSGYRKILLRRDYWESSSDTDKLALVAHEMIHCFLNQRDHIDDVPGHIMNSYIPYFKDMDDLEQAIDDHVQRSCK